MFQSSCYWWPVSTWEVSCHVMSLRWLTVTLHYMHRMVLEFTAHLNGSTARTADHTTRVLANWTLHAHTHTNTLLYSGVARVQRLGGGAKLVSRVPSSSFPPIPLPSFLSLFPSPSFLTFLPLLSFSPSFLPKIQLGVWGSAASSPSGARGGAFLPYFEIRRRSSCNDFGSFCTDQNIHLTQDRSYRLLPPYTSYDYFSSDLCWS